MKVLITGGAGFIGSNLARVLSSDPRIDVSVLDDLSSGRRENLDGLRVEFVEGSILDRDVLRSLVTEADSVVHLAARPSVPRSVADPVTTHNINVNGTMEVLEAIRAKGSGHIVFASSSSVYGASTELPKHIGLVPRPISPYAVSKLAGESYVLAYRHVYDIGALAVRFFNVYGPGQNTAAAYSPVLPAFIDAARQGQDIPVHGDGLQSRDFTFVGSVALTLATAAVSQTSLDVPLNLAFGVRYSLLEVAEILRELLPTGFGVAHGPQRAGDVRHSQADPSQMEALFPTIEPVSLTEGLRRTVDWWQGGEWWTPQFTAGGEF